MNKRLSLLVNEAAPHQQLQKTTRTELSEEESLEDENTVSRAISILQPAVQKDQDRSRTGRRFVEFEEFNVGNSNGHTQILKRKFNIEVPETRFQQFIGARAPTSGIPSKLVSPSGTVCKEPPAPSNKGKAKAFVFPVVIGKNINETVSRSPFAVNKPSVLVKQPCSIPNITTFDKPQSPYPSEPESPASGSRHPVQGAGNSEYERLGREELLIKLNDQWKELLKKSAQIQLLQRIVAENIRKPASIESSRLFQEKEALTSELMGKLVQLTECLKQRNQELALYKYENNKMECTIEAMKHDAYLASKQQQNGFLAHSHNDPKNRRQVSTHWEEDLVMRTSINKRNGAREIQSIARKMEQLKHGNLQQISMVADSQEDNNRSVVTPLGQGCPSMTKKNKPGNAIASKAKEDPTLQGGWYCQTSKNKPKASGYFDFKQNTKENANQTGWQPRRKPKTKEPLQ